MKLIAFLILINFMKRDDPFDLPILNLNLENIDESFGSKIFLFVNSNGWIKKKYVSFSFKYFFNKYLNRNQGKNLR